MLKAPASVELFSCRDGVQLAFSVHRCEHSQLAPLVMVNGLSGVKEEWGPLPHILARYADSCIVSLLLLITRLSLLLLSFPSFSSSFCSQGNEPWPCLTIEAWVPRTAPPS